jgi:hypothetical protein
MYIPIYENMKSPNNAISCFIVFMKALTFQLPIFGLRPQVHCPLRPVSKWAPVLS